MRAVLRVLLAVVLVWAMYFLKANVWFRLYPAVVVALALTAFASSLFRKRTLAELFATRGGRALDARGVAYCRKVTVAWTIFLAVHLVVTLATVFWASREVWAWYNGCIAYVLIGAMFVGEGVVRFRSAGTGRRLTRCREVLQASE